jgi:hypothetical protein
MILYISIGLLIIGQIYLYLLFIKTKKGLKVKKLTKYSLKPVPKKVEYSDVEPEMNTIYSVLETIKIEEWDFNVKRGFDLYDVEFLSNSGIIMSCSLRIDGDDGTLSLIRFNIRDDKFGSIHVDNDSYISFDILSFTWDYIVSYHESINKETMGRYLSTINNINSKLKTLSRSNRLKEILDGE